MTKLKFISCLVLLMSGVSCKTPIFQDEGNIDAVSFLFQSGARVTTQRIISDNVNTITYFQAASNAIKAAIDVNKLTPEDIRNQVLTALGDRVDDQFYPFFDVGISLMLDTYKRFYEVNNIGDKIDPRVKVILSSIVQGIDDAIKTVLTRGLSVQDFIEPNPFKRATDKDLKL